MKKYDSFVNLTPHAVRLNDGTVYNPSGVVARVGDVFGLPDDDNIMTVWYNDVEGLPAPVDGTCYIVSAMALAAVKGKRVDVVAPATGHPDCIRNEKGQIVSVPGFVR